MRRSILPLLIALAVGTVAVPAAAGDITINTDHCNVNTSYDVSVDDVGVRFQRDFGTPSKVFMHDGQLRVDGHAVTVSRADAQSLRQYEHEVRQALPEMAAIAHEGVDIGFSALTTVAATFANAGVDRDDLMERLNRKHADALRRIDQTLGHGQWKQDAIADVIENTVEDAVPELVGTVTAGAVKAALSGDQAQIAALEARADSLEESIDREVNARADQLGVRAQGLCKRLAAMDALQQQWRFRLRNDARLQLMHWDKSSRQPENGDKSREAVATTH